MKKRKVKHVLQLALVLFVGIGTGLFIRVNTRSNTSTIGGYASDYYMLESVVDTVANHWVNTTGETIDFEEKAIEGFLNNIGDPHTTYFTQEAAQNFTDAVVHLRESVLRSR